MRFKYKARTKEGKLRKGNIEASSQKSALYILEKYGLFILSLKEVEKESFLEKKILLRRISDKDVMIFTRQLSVMLKSAISPVETLRALVVQIENPEFRDKILTLAEKVDGGSSLSQAFSLFPGVFDQFFISVIRSGEATGKVADSLNYLANHLEREYNLRHKIRGAMIYPAFVILVFIAVIFLSAFFIIPKLTEILKSFGGELPLTTKAIMLFSEFIRKGGWILFLLIIILLFFLPRYLKKNESYKKVYDKILLKLPIIGAFNKKIYLTRFAENFSVLISAGLPITQALKIVKGIIGNFIYKEIIGETESKVSRGEKISSVLVQYPEQIPSFVLQMVSTGEETGRLDETLLDIVNFYRQEIERTTDNLTSILEPILILFLGIGIAVLAISVFIPLFKIGLGGMGGM